MVHLLKLTLPNGLLEYKLGMKISQYIKHLKLSLKICIIYY